MSYRTDGYVPLSVRQSRLVARLWRAPGSVHWLRYHIARWLAKRLP